MFFPLSDKTDVTLANENEMSGNAMDESIEESRTRPQSRNFQSTIKDCIQTCRRLLFRGDRDLNYCIEGCRIRIYRKIYECVYDQCNDKGNGIPTKYSREQYHQCVYLCKVKPKIRAPKSTTTTTTTEGPLKETFGQQSVPIIIKDTSKPYIPLEYHYYDVKEKKKKPYKS